MKPLAKRVPAHLDAVAACQRQWDGALVEFFVLTTKRRSHDRHLDGTSMYQPVGAIARQTLWQGEPSPNKMAATAAAMITYRAMCKEPALDLIHRPA